MAGTGPPARYSRITWYANVTTGYGMLSSASDVTWAFVLTHAVSGQFRIRADYLRSDADMTNPTPTVPGATSRS